MKLPSYLDPRKIARASGALAVVQSAIEESNVQRDWLRKTAYAASHSDALVKPIMDLSSIHALSDKATVHIHRTLTDQIREIKTYRDMVDPLGQMDHFAARAIDPMKDAIEAARCAGALTLPNMLEQYRAADLDFAAQLLVARSIPGWQDAMATSLNAHTALAGMLDQSHLVDWRTLSAIDSVTGEALVGLNSVNQTLKFLDIAGLLRLPRRRPRTPEEQRRHVKRLIQNNRPSGPVTKAHSLIHRHEKFLRHVITQRMEDAYGDDWAKDRLPICGCKKLLGKTLEDDETILDHADYAHYALIMCHGDHFETIFSEAFKDAKVLAEMIGRLGALRARAHHARRFTPEHMRELAALWRAMQVGFEALLDDLAFEH